MNNQSFELKNVKNLDSNGIANLQKLNTLDFNRVYRKLTQLERGLSFEPEKARDYILHYKRYLLLWLLKKEYRNLVMPLKVDGVWHAHILDTKIYTDHCNILFGRYYHHNPYPADVDIDNTNYNSEEIDKAKSKYQLNILKSINLFQDYFEIDLVALMLESKK